MVRLFTNVGLCTIRLSVNSLKFSVIFKSPASQEITEMSLMTRTSKNADTETLKNAQDRHSSTHLPIKASSTGSIVLTVLLSIAVFSVASLGKPPCSAASPS